MIGQRINALRKKLGLDHEEFARKCGIAPGTLLAIEAGKKGYTIDSLLRITYFLGLEIEDIAAANFAIPSKDRIKELMKQFHEAHNSKAHLKLDKKRRITNTITEDLLSTNFLNSPKRIKEIIKFCRDEYRVKFKGSSVTNVMKQLEGKGLIKIIPSERKNVFLYEKMKFK